MRMDRIPLSPMRQIAHPSGTRQALSVSGKDAKTPHVIHALRGHAGHSLGLNAGSPFEA
jgi:hypothetical protein